jgi:acyl-CoA synthetase (AMP-forming)/AMP-acid ligase II
MEQGVDIVQEDATIAMLCPTGLEFLVTWITLMRMGYGVVLVA